MSGQGAGAPPEPDGSSREPEGSSREPEGSSREPEGSSRERGGSSREALEASWRRQLILWHGGYGLIWAATLVAALAGSQPTSARLAAGGVLVAMGLTYLAAGVPALTRTSDRSALAYHLGSWCLLCVGMVLAPTAPLWFMLWALFPHLWSMLERRQAAIGSVAGMGAFVLTRWLLTGFDRQAVPTLALTGAASVTLSLALGLFIDRMVREASARADTIDELHRAHEALALAERAAGISSERERLSREIHDTLAQGFTSILALTRAADAALARSDVDTARARLALIEATSAENLTEARRIVAALSPGHLESRSLVEALERLVSGVGASGPPELALCVRGEPATIGGAKDIVLLRAAQEALANAHRHARARKVDLELTYTPHLVQLVVADDGIGMSEVGSRSGYGLDGIQSRAREVGGSMSLGAGPRGGSRLVVEVPR